MFNIPIPIYLHKKLIEETCNRYELDLKKNVKFVDVPHQWAIDHGITNTEPRDVAFSTTEQPTNRKIIVLANIIPPGSAKSIWSRVDYSIGSKRAKIINTPELFIKHLVLHEIAHLVKGIRQEGENIADDWAAKEMGII